MARSWEYAIRNGVGDWQWSDEEEDGGTGVKIHIKYCLCNPITKWTTESYCASNTPLFETRLFYLIIAARKPFKTNGYTHDLMLWLDGSELLAICNSPTIHGLSRPK